MKHLLVLLMATCCATVISTAHAVGLLPIPVLKNVGVTAQAGYDSATGLYTYAYAIFNPVENTGEIGQVWLDILHRGPVENYDTSGLTIPEGGTRSAFDAVLPRQSLVRPYGLDNRQFVPVGQNVPGLWDGGIGTIGAAFFGAGAAANRIKPGQTATGLEVISRGVPTLRSMDVVPKWVLLVHSEDDVTLADRVAAGQVEKDMRFRTVTLGPSGVRAGDVEHWNQLRDDLARATQLGWIADLGLATALRDQLAAARREVDAQIPSLARARLNDLLATINAIRPGQCRGEARDLMRLNTDQLLANLDRATQGRIEPLLTVTPESAEFKLGDTLVATATLVNLADNNAPLANWPISWSVDSGPQAGLNLNGTTDANGQLGFTYVGRTVGLDEISAKAYVNNETPIEGKGRAKWQGGPDLAIPFFSGPELHSAGGRAFYISDWTMNMGNVAAPPSVTRYFIYPNSAMNSAEAVVVGQRNVPALAPREYSQVWEQPYTVPGQWPEGVYYLAACADADEQIIELDENNNCSYNKLKGWVSISVPVHSPAIPPDCSNAAASVVTLWPPNHKLVDIAVKGVKTRDGDAALIAITGITQDEPVNGLGDGDTAPDGFGVGTATARLRAERSGTGNGRVYAVAYTATASGGSCSGTALVGVPHDRGHGSTPVDDGQQYDSTQR